MDKTYRRNKTKDDHGERATSAKGTKVASPRSPLLPATATVANESLRRAGERRPALQLWREGRSFALFKALPNKMSGPPCVEPSLSGSTRRSTVPTTPCLGWLGWGGGERKRTRSCPPLRLQEHHGSREGEHPVNL